MYLPSLFLNIIDKIIFLYTERVIDYCFKSITSVDIYMERESILSDGQDVFRDILLETQGNTEGNTNLTSHTYSHTYTHRLFSSCPSSHCSLPSLLLSSCPSALPVIVFSIRSNDLHRPFSVY